MAAGFVEHGIQNTACCGDFAFGNTEFELSVVAVADVSGLHGMGGEVFAWCAVYGLDMVQPAFRFVDKTRHALFFHGGSGERISAAAYRRITL